MKKKTLWLTTMVLIVFASACQTKYVHVGPNWGAVNKLESSDNTFKVEAWGRKQAKLGDVLSFQVVSEKSGRLWVVQVDPEDSVNLLFPNHLSEDNAIKADQTYTIPAPEDTWQIRAAEPAGKSVVAFIVTVGDTDLNDVLGQSRSMTKALRLVEKSPSWGLTQQVIDVK